MANKLITILGLLAITAWAQEGPREIRVVNGREVDITPVVEWYEVRVPEGQRKPERPMQHWKKMQIVSIRKQVAGWDLCAVKNEQEQTVEILIANLPGKVREPLIAESKIHARMQELRAAGQAVTSNPFATGPKARNLTAMQANGIAAELIQLGKQRDAISAAASVARGTKVYAMKSGRKYAEMDVWDCGKVKVASRSQL